MYSPSNYVYNKSILQPVYYTQSVILSTYKTSLYNWHVVTLTHL